MSSPGSPRRGVFVSYSHADTRWLKRLQIHIEPLVRDGGIEIWDDTSLKPGSDWRAEIEKALASAKVAILLVSADFLASRFIATEELPRLLDAAKRDGTVILPLIVGPSRFEASALARFQAINPPSEYLTKLPGWKRDEFFVKTTNAVEDALAAGAPDADGAVVPDPPSDEPPTDSVAVAPVKRDDTPDEVEPPARSKEPSVVLSGGGPPCFSPDGEKVAIAYGVMLQIVDTRTGDLDRVTPPTMAGLAARSPAFSTDGFSVAAAARSISAGDAGAWVWDRDNRESLCTVTAQSAYDGEAPRLIFSPEGRYFTAPELSPLIWDTRSWEPVWGAEAQVRPATTFGATEGWVAVAGERSVVFVDLPSGTASVSVHAGDAPITSIDAHPSDEAVLSVSETHLCLHRRDDDPVWEIAVPERWSQVSARFSPTGRYVVVGTKSEHGRHHLLYDADGKELSMRRFGAHRFAADDRHLVVYTNRIIRLWDLPDHRGLQFATSADDNELLGVSFDGRYVATWKSGPAPRGLTDPRVYVWDVSDGTPALEFDFAALWLAFDPSGPRCAAVGQQEMRLCELPHD
jgi:WD40 repeat protein